jgi:hypothetical protein
MKKLKIISIIAMSIGLIGIISCNCNYEHTPNGVEKSTEYSYEHTDGIWLSTEYAIEQKTIDSCEYIIVFGQRGRNIIHKANCKNSFHLNTKF